MWQHAPPHHFENGDTFFITGATLHKQHFYTTSGALDALRDLLFAKAKDFECWLQAWCLLSNHYHLVVKCEIGERVREMLARFHSEAADELNHRDGVKGRRVWYQFWDKTLTFEGSWLVRLRYTHENAVHHGLVTSATQYPWCSASWFERTAPRKFVDIVRGMKMDSVKIYDEFEPTRAVALPPHS